MLVSHRFQPILNLFCHVCYSPLAIERPFKSRRSGPRLCENSTRYNHTWNFEPWGHAQSEKTQKFVLRSALRPNQISFSHSLGQSRHFALRNKQRAFSVSNHSEVGRRHTDRGVIPSPYCSGMMPLGTCQNGNFPSGSQHAQRMLGSRNPES